ncbi:chemotaxis protein CheB [Hymenobacter nivis]|uniref:protein-glutamate methylesterase n=1 Tax=Hymenobacter nivis TaxID=1850093 RepID=A0A502GBA9_9BACT|nr:chemotaxis protein CheB [Hymenobacter nivis]TPG57993.1 chemotaxis protein CheB [Hymenobacter nivis]
MASSSAFRYRHVVVIGASAGGVPALLALAKTLPADFPAPIFMVLHVGAALPSMLPELLSAVSKLPARHPESGELIEPGIIYVAPPAHQLLLNGNWVLVTQGPPEKGFRPSIDTLFRSAASAYGGRVIGVILTGFLSDGALGLQLVQQHGGLTIVQDPHDAEQPAMPTHALALVTPDYLVPLAQLGPLLVRLTTAGAPANRRPPGAKPRGWAAAKLLLLLLWLALVPGLARAQAIAVETVPPLAFGAMFRQYPQARQITWRRFQAWYQASYTQGSNRRLVRFSSNGDVEATGQDIALSALSLPIQHTLTTYYPTRTFCRAIEVTNARTGALTYEMATCETALSRTITLTANGRKIPRPD